MGQMRGSIGPRKEGDFLLGHGGATAGFEGRKAC